MPRSVNLWRHPDFLRLWAAQFGSAIGSRITRTVLPMLALLMVEASPSQVAILASCEVAPGLVVSLFAGGLADRRAKRPLLIRADLFRAALILTIPLLAGFDLVQIWHLYLVAFGMGAASTLFAIVDNTYLPVLLPPEALTDANSKLVASDAVAEGIGPWLGGVLVQLIGAPLALVFDAVSYLWSAALLSKIKTPETPGTEPDAASLFADAKEGFQRCRNHPALAPLLSVELLDALAGGFLMAFYLVIAISLLGISPAMIGLIIGIGGIGAFLGAMVTAPLENRLGEARALQASLIVGRLVSLCIPLAIHFPDAAVWLLIAGQLVGDAALVTFAILALSLRQRAAPSEVLGRINASFQLISQTALLAGTVLAAILALWLPLPVLVWTGAVIGLLTIPLAFRLPLTARENADILP
jgi:MFS family permease